MAVQSDFADRVCVIFSGLPNLGSLLEFPMYAKVQSRFSQNCKNRPRKSDGRKEKLIQSKCFSTSEVVGNVERTDGELQNSPAVGRKRTRQVASQSSVCKQHRFARVAPSEEGKVATLSVEREVAHFHRTVGSHHELT